MKIEPILYYFLFSVHFVKMLALIDVQGQSNFDCLNKDIEAQLKYVYEAIDCDVEYNDMFEFMKKYFQESNDMNSPAKVKEKAETSRLIRDRGNKVLFEKKQSWKQILTLLKRIFSPLICTLISEK